MGSAVFERFATAQRTLEEADAALGWRLSRAMLQGSEVRPSGAQSVAAALGDVAMAMDR